MKKLKFHHWLTIIVTALVIVAFIKLTIGLTDAERKELTWKRRIMEWNKD